MIATHALVAVSLFTAAPAQDKVVVRGRKALLGSVVERTQETLRFNPYFSTRPEMVWGVEEFSAKSVKSVESVVPPVEQFRLRLIEHRGNAAELLELAEFCKKERLKEERLIALELLETPCPFMWRVLIKA